MASDADNDRSAAPLDVTESLKDRLVVFIGKAPYELYSSTKYCTVYKGQGGLEAYVVNVSARDSVYARASIDTQQPIQRVSEISAAGLADADDEIAMSTIYCYLEDIVPRIRPREHWDAQLRARNNVQRTEPTPDLGYPKLVNEAEGPSMGKASGRVSQSRAPQLVEAGVSSPEKRESCRHSTDLHHCKDVQEKLAETGKLELRGWYHDWNENRQKFVEQQQSSSKLNPSPVRELESGTSKVRFAGYTKPYVETVISAADDNESLHQPDHLVGPAESLKQSANTEAQNKDLEERGRRQERGRRKKLVRTIDESRPVDKNACPPKTADKLSSTRDKYAGKESRRTPRSECKSTLSSIQGDESFPVTYTESEDPSCTDSDVVAACCLEWFESIKQNDQDVLQAALQYRQSIAVCQESFDYILQELRICYARQNVNFSMAPVRTTSFDKWRIALLGPQGGPYTGGIFMIMVDIGNHPERWSFQPYASACSNNNKPVTSVMRGGVQVLTPLYHPYVDHMGRAPYLEKVHTTATSHLVDIAQKAWELLVNVKHLPPDDAIRKDILNEIKDQPETFESRARQATTEHAMSWVIARIKEIEDEDEGWETCSDTGKEDEVEWPVIARLR